jgi:hypothetical protein
MHLIGGWVDPRADLDAVTKRRNSYSSRESNPVVQPIAEENIWI